MHQIVFDFDGPIFDGRQAAQSALDQTFEHFESRFARPRLSFDTLPLLASQPLISMFYHELDRSEVQEIWHFYHRKLQEQNEDSVLTGRSSTVFKG